MFDAHCHIDPEADGFRSSPESAAGRLLCGVSPGDWDVLATAAAAWPGSVAAYGLHPWHAAEGGEGWLDKLETRLAKDPSAWLGEAGLDGLRTDRAPADLQDRIFRAQLRLAARLDRPVNLHCVKAWEPLVRALDDDYLRSGPRPFIVHSFGGPHQFIAALADRGAFFTVGPLSARRDGERPRRRAALLPADRLLVESDAFLTPGVDATADLDVSLAWLAAARTMTKDAAAQLVAANSRRLFTHAR